MAEQANESGEKLSEIARLTTRAHDVSLAVSFWNRWYMICVALTVVLAVGVFITQFVASRRSAELSGIQDALIAEKDRLSKLDSDDKNLQIATVKSDSEQKNAALVARAKEADARIAEARLGSAEANERAKKAQASLSNAEQHSAEANAKAEGFRLDIAKANESAAQAQAQVAGAMAEAAKANLELARIKLPRTLNLEQQKRIAKALSKFSGTDVAFVVFSDPESLSLLGELDSTLQQAGWNRVEAPPTFSSDIGFNTSRGMVFQANDVGLKISFPPDAPTMEPIVRAAAEAISAEGVPCEPHFSDRLRGTKVIIVSVGQKRL
jgi:hypothetical protein